MRVRRRGAITGHQQARRGEREALLDRHFSAGLDRGGNALDVMFSVVGQESSSRNEEYPRDRLPLKLSDWKFDFRSVRLILRSDPVKRGDG